MGGKREVQRSAGAPGVAAPSAASIAVSQPESTRRRRGGRNTQPSDDRFRTLAAATGQLVWTATADGLAKEAAIWRAFTGQHEPDAQGLGWMEAVHPDDRSRCRVAWTRPVATKTVDEEEYRIRRFDGVYRTFLVRRMPVLDASGAIQEWVAASTDISERKQLERELAHRVSQLEATFEAIVDAIVLYDAEGRIVDMNRATRQLLGLDRDASFQLASFEERMTHLNIRDAQGQPLPLEHISVRRALRGEVVTAQAGDNIVTTLDGRQVYLSDSGSPVRDAEGNVVGAVVIMRDVTEQRQGERRTHEALAALLAMAQLGSADTAHPEDGTPEDGANAVAQQLAALTRSVLGCRCVGIVAVDRAAEMVVRILAVEGLSAEEERQWRAAVPQTLILCQQLDPTRLARLAVEDDVVPIDLTQPAFDALSQALGSRTWLLAPMRPGGQFLGALVVDYGHSVYHDTAAEREITSMAAKLSVLAIERDRLLGEAEAAREAIHELIHPVTILKTSIQTLARQVARRASGAMADLVPAKLWTRVERQVDRLARMAIDLRDATSAQKGQLELQPEHCNLTALVRETVSDQRRTYPSRSIRLHLNAASGPLLVMADSDRIGQVITNYLTNALRYSPPDRPVDVRLEVIHGQARVSVRDKGPGIRADAQERIWERYERAKGIVGHKEIGAGLGLGLYISRAIIERHQGDVGLKS
ncbi:MAG TPA: PAS domain S-box protein, partial [Ktedonobacterales bacterium]